jgi:phage terminase large subunit-like protein
MEWDLSCPDWESRMRTGQSLVPALPLDNEAAERAVRIFNRLRLADVPGNPRMAEAAGDWFRDIVRALFGSWDAETQERHIREVFALVPKKNSKTSYGALLMLSAASSMTMAARSRSTSSASCY